ncbi:transcriptional regulator GcvA [Ideonella sp. DXS29W]|uniref:Transcriptional regulator GcvA n=1 Tax=Ideonella lacteola TaxID=2984193 RepID=A0ABU9BX44_9BURK
MQPALVHLNALRAFEASARHRSFAAAAAELHVTPAAVGQLVRGLEEWLGTPVFHRSSSGKLRLTLTESAQRALPDIQAGFDRLAQGLGRLKERAAESVITVTVSPAFAAKWLLPRLDDFHAAHPDLDVRLDTSLRPLDFVAQRIDIGVRYGAGRWPGLVADKWLEEEVYPVCSPSLSAARSWANPADLLRETLIHDLSMDEHEGFLHWTGWLRAAGVTGRLAPRGLKINNSGAVLQAAAQGQGIALARGLMASDDVSSGRLVRLFPDIRCPSPLAYHVVYRPESAELARVMAFRQWLFSQVPHPTTPHV